jgi:hypothetical protein
MTTFLHEHPSPRQCHKWLSVALGDKEPSFIGVVLALVELLPWTSLRLLTHRSSARSHLCVGAIEEMRLPRPRKPLGNARASNGLQNDLDRVYGVYLSYHTTVDTCCAWSSLGSVALTFVMVHEW